ncbi:SMP-30/gluconolactonase/LRE family protein [Psychrobacillus sp.]|uniref:NHL domain-containing protein n=1 Tax=Psychrobacillus sp. TaxID=1871623 RepID=UPI0028BD7292|nr:SMP-30/gluconolactonase/LRE family protein [Psychrobacillus sp.]
MTKHRSWASFLLASAIFLVFGSITTTASVIDYKPKQTEWIHPQGLWMNPSGELTVVDAGSHTIHSFNKERQEVAAVGGNQGLDAYGLPIGGYADFNIQTAIFDQPNDVIIDAKGTMYISDFNNHTIRKIVNGVVYTHAGTGKAGYRDGAKTVAQFNHPSGLALDAENNLYVTDTMNHLIRKITPEGDVSTVAGKFFTDGGYVSGPVKEARFNEPTSIAFDEIGNFYVADSGNQLIRYVTDNEVSTFAGAVMPVDSTTGYREGGHQNGEKEQALFNYPKDLHYEKGVLFIADSLNHRIRAITKQGITIDVAGQGEPGDKLGEAYEVQFDTPTAVTYFDGQLYVADSANHKVKMVPVDLNKLKHIQTDEEIIEATPLNPKAKKMQVWFNNELIPLPRGVNIVQKDGKTYIPVQFLDERWKNNFHGISNDVDGTKLFIKGRVFIEQSNLQKWTNFRIIKVEEFNALIISND